MMALYEVKHKFRIIFLAVDFFERFVRTLKQNMKIRHEMIPTSRTGPGLANSSVIQKNLNFARSNFIGYNSITNLRTRTGKVR